MHLHGAAAYDPPPGDGHEDNQGVGLATDGNPTTFWETEHYTTQNFGGLKTGVGLVLDAGSPVKLSGLAVTTDTPGFTAKIEAGSTPGGPWTPVSAVKTVASTTTFSLHPSSSTRYYLLWLTSLAPGVDLTHVNEVHAVG